ncbi:nucleotide exchange factor GrpE [Candidatus Heimdallarchaeota archaeon B3_Heim]|nr:MAG: nucleotide exchange factor GrpE [Candidatus Heimdallarchaeota archaeon B3_Heim]
MPMKEHTPQNTKNNSNFYDIDEQIKESDSKKVKIPTYSKSMDSKSSQQSKQGELESQIEKLKEELVQKEKTNQKDKERFLRALADYENLEKRTKAERSRILKNANANLLTTFLELADTLEKAKSSFTDSSNANTELKEGFLAIERQFSSILNNAGVERLECLGTKFDPAFHEAVFVRKDPGEGEDIILEEVQAGYTLNTTLLRPSKVIIAK